MIIQLNEAALSHKDQLIAINLDKQNWLDIFSTEPGVELREAKQNKTYEAKFNTCGHVEGIPYYDSFEDHVYTSKYMYINILIDVEIGDKYIFDLDRQWAFFPVGLGYAMVDDEDFYDPDPSTIHNETEDGETEQNEYDEPYWPEDDILDSVQQKSESLYESISITPYNENDFEWRQMYGVEEVYRHRDIFFDEYPLYRGYIQIDESNNDLFTPIIEVLDDKDSFYREVKKSNRSMPKDNAKSWVEKWFLYFYNSEKQKLADEIDNKINSRGYQKIQKFKYYIDSVQQVAEHYLNNCNIYMFDTDILVDNNNNIYLDLCSKEKLDKDDIYNINKMKDYFNQLSLGVTKIEIVGDNIIRIYTDV